MAWHAAELENQLPHFEGSYKASGQSVISRQSALVMQSPTSKSAVGSRRSASQGKQEFWAATADARGVIQVVVMLAE